jgi:hypothetical protein
MTPQGRKRPTPAGPCSPAPPPAARSRQQTPPADTEARSSRPFRRQPVHTPHQQAAAQVPGGSSAGSPPCTGPFVPCLGSDVRRRPGGRPHDSRSAPAAQELQVRTGQRHPDLGGQLTRPVTRTGQARIPGMHYRLPRHERLNLSRKAEMTRKITGITCRIGRRSAAPAHARGRTDHPVMARRGRGHTGDQASVRIRRLGAPVCGQVAPRSVTRRRTSILVADPSCELGI